MPSASLIDFADSARDLLTGQKDLSQRLLGLYSPEQEALRRKKALGQLTETLGSRYARAGLTGSTGELDALQSAAKDFELGWAEREPAQLRAAIDAVQPALRNFEALTGQEAQFGGTYRGQPTQAAKEQAVRDAAVYGGTFQGQPTEATKEFASLLPLREADVSGEFQGKPTVRKWEAQARLEQEQAWRDYVRRLDTSKRLGETLAALGVPQFFRDIAFGTGGAGGGLVGGLINAIKQWATGGGGTPPPGSPAHAALVRALGLGGTGIGGLLRLTNPLAAQGGELVPNFDWLGNEARPAGQDWLNTPPDQWSLQAPDLAPSGFGISPLNLDMLDQAFGSPGGFNPAPTPEAGAGAMGPTSPLMLAASPGTTMSDVAPTGAGMLGVAGGGLGLASNILNATQNPAAIPGAVASGLGTASSLGAPGLVGQVGNILGLAGSAYSASQAKEPAQAVPGLAVGVLNAANALGLLGTGSVTGPLALPLLAYTIMEQTGSKSPPSYEFAANAENKLAEYGGSIPAMLDWAATMLKANAGRVDPERLLSWLDSARGVYDFYGPGYDQSPHFAAPSRERAGYRPDLYAGVRYIRPEMVGGDTTADSGTSGASYVPPAGWDTRTAFYEQLRQRGAPIDDLLRQIHLKQMRQTEPPDSR